MKKIDKKGFMLTELLVTSTLVCTVLIFLYTQFFSVKKSYENSFKYNTVNGLYALSNIRSFLVDSDIYILKQNLNLNSYVDLMDLENNKVVLKDDVYFQTLITKLNVKNLIFTKENLTDLINDLNNIPDRLENMKTFIRYIDYDKKGNLYRIIVEYNNNTFATLLVGDNDEE